MAEEYLRSLWVQTGATRGVDAGVDQGSPDDIVGTNDMSKLGGRDRPLPYQVVISFPGAALDFSFTDTDGENLASSGFDLAAQTRKWLGEKACEENGIPVDQAEAILLRHFYMDWANLQYTPGTTRVRNFRNRGMSTVASINPNWKFYYVEAQLECKVMLVLVTVGWLQSPNCLGEFDDVEQMVSIKENADDTELLFIVLQEEVLEDPKWSEVEAKAKALDCLIKHYFPEMDSAEKEAVEQYILRLTIGNEKLDFVPDSDMPAVPDHVKMVDWDDATMG